MQRLSPEKARIQALIWSQELQHYSDQVHMALKSGDLEDAKVALGKLSEMTDAISALLELVDPQAGAEESN